MIEVTAAELMQLQADAMSERQLQTEVERLLKAGGWRFYHTHRSDRSQPGFPDICAVRPPQILFAELKRQKRSNFTVEQRGWHDDLTAVVGAWAVYLWRPMHLLDGTIARILA